MLDINPVRDLARQLTREEWDTLLNAIREQVVSQLEVEGSDPEVLHELRGIRRLRTRIFTLTSDIEVITDGNGYV